MREAPPDVPSETQGTAMVSRPRGPTWPWAVGSIAAVVVVLLSTVIGHTLVTRARHAAATVAAPATPWLPLLAVAHPAAGASYFGLDTRDGHLVALATTSERVCPPQGTCPSPLPSRVFDVLDGQTGQRLAGTPLTGNASAAQAATLLLVDATHDLAYAVAPHAVVIFSTATGARVGGYALPATLGLEQIRGGTLGAAGTRLYLTDGRQIALLDAATGQVLARQALPSGSPDVLVDGPVLDAAHNQLYVMLNPPLNPPPRLAQLDVLDAGTLRPVAGGDLTFSPGTRLGPIDPASNALLLFDLVGIHPHTAARLPLGPVPQDTHGPASPSGPPLTTPVPALQGALAIGWGSTPNLAYVVRPEEIALVDMRSGRTLGALPLASWQSPALPLAYDAARGLLYLPVSHGAIAIVRAPAAGTRALNSATALVLARAAMARFLPDTNQDPPFVSAETFPLRPGMRTNPYYIHFADLGWQGPYAGGASVSVGRVPGHPGTYTVTLSITWHQLFDRQHIWTCLVLPDGSVRLTADRGDAVP